MIPLHISQDPDVAYQIVKELYFDIKKYLWMSFYFCFLDDSTMAGFVQMIEEGNAKECKCLYRSFPEHKIENCRNFQKWKSNHIAPINLVYDQFLEGLVGIEDFAQWAFLYSADCSCFEAIDHE